MNLLSQSRSKNLTRLARSPPGPSFSSATWRTSTKAPRATRSARTTARYRPGRSRLRRARPVGQDTVLIAAGEVKTVLVALDIAPDYQRDRAELCADSRRPPDYVIVVAASDWLNKRYPAAAASLTQALKAGEDRHPDPEPDLEAEP